MHPVLFTLPLPVICAFFGAVGGAIAGLLLAGGRWPGRGRAGAVAAGLGVAAGGVLGVGLGPRGGAGLPVYGYGSMLALSLTAGFVLVRALGRRQGLPSERLSRAILVSAACALVGARLLFIATNPALWTQPTHWLALREGGLVAYGGFLGGLFGAWLYGRRAGVGLLGFGDLAAPALGLGLGLTRIGCYLYGCDFGRPLGPGAPHWLRALGTFPQGSPAYLFQLARAHLPRTAVESFPVHPTQLYMSLAGFALFAVALLARRRRRFEGKALLAVAVLYGVFRFFLEWMRDDPQRGFAFGLSTSQLLSLAVVPWAAWLYLRAARSRPPVVQPAGVPARRPASDLGRR
jgi:phosphatidylglycerol:prolipoprotein diacylglycerol transferase